MDPVRVLCTCPVSKTVTPTHAHYTHKGVQWAARRPQLNNPSFTVDALIKELEASHGLLDLLISGAVCVHTI